MHRKLNKKNFNESGFSKQGYMTNILKLVAIGTSIPFELLNLSTFAAFSAKMDLIINCSCRLEFAWYSKIEDSLYKLSSSLLYVANALIAQSII